MSRAGNLLLTSLGAMAAGAAVGAGIGSFIPVVGTAIGGLIGFIVAGIGVLFKLSNYRDEIDTSNFTTDAISKEAQKLSQNISIPLDQNITQNSNLLSAALSNIKDNTLDTTLATEEFKKKADETNNVITIMNTSVSDLTLNQSTLNTYVTDANNILPTYNGYLETNISKLNRQADAANKAASAQERLNRAISNSKTSSTTGTSNKSKSTTTR